MSKLPIGRIWRSRWFLHDLTFSSLACLNTFVETSTIAPQRRFAVDKDGRVCKSWTCKSTIKSCGSCLLTQPRNTTAFATAPPLTYWGQFDEIAKYNVHLNFFEKLWAAWYAYMQNDVLATGIMSFVLHELVYFGRALPWTIIGQIPYLNKYKIQGVRFPGLISEEQLH